MLKRFTKSAGLPISCQCLFLIRHTSHLPCYSALRAGPSEAVFASSCCHCLLQVASAKTYQCWLYLWILSPEIPCQIQFSQSIMLSLTLVNCYMMSVTIVSSSWPAAKAKMLGNHNKEVVSPRCCFSAVARTAKLALLTQAGLTKMGCQAWGPVKRPLHFGSK